MVVNHVMFWEFCPKKTALDLLSPLSRSCRTAQAHIVACLLYVHDKIFAHVNTQSHKDDDILLSPPYVGTPLF